jgi:hypothetical protein
VQVDYNVVHLRTSLVQLFVLLLQNFEKVVQMIKLKRFGGAPNGYPLAPLSDHGPILLLLQWTYTLRCRRGRKLFRYEIMWESHEDFPSMMIECHVGAELKKLNGELEHLKSAPKTISSNVLHLYSD